MIRSYLSLVKFSHTLFALPFAAIGFIVGIHAKGQLNMDWRQLVLVLICMVTARNAAMAFNRWADRHIDEKNPRTKSREIPAGRLSPHHVLLFVSLNASLFIVATYFINPLCFLLSPVALFTVLGYSYTKRFSWLCHVFLGLGLALAPIGAYLAVTGSFDWLPILYAAAVICWVAGFDIIYALQDIDFDQAEHLQSVPARFGLSKSLWVSSMLHVFCAVFILMAASILHSQYGLSAWLYAGTICFIGLLTMQHVIVGKGNLDRINLAFFTTNGIASVVLALCTIIDFYF